MFFFLMTLMTTFKLVLHVSHCHTVSYVVSPSVVPSLTTSLSSSLTALPPCNYALKTADFCRFLQRKIGRIEGNTYPL